MATAGGLDGVATVSDSPETVLACLRGRVSVGELQAPAPTAAQREAIFRAALRAPDHGQLRPWRFRWVEGEDDLRRLGDVFVAVESTLTDEPLTDAQRNKIAGRPLRAPLVLIVSAAIKTHPKVPAQEQLLSTAAAVEAMLLAAHAQGIGAMWRTGLFTYAPALASALGLPPEEQLLGFLYLGTPKGPLRTPPALDIADFFTRWPPQAG